MFNYQNSIQPWVTVIGQWNDETFGEGPRIEGVLNHMKEEIEEVRANPKDATELADLFILWCALVHQLNATKTIELTIAQKMVKNWSRKWNPPDENGVCQHIEEATS